MIIRVLPQLNSRQHWIAFCRREVPYCFVESPECLVDFQNSHLQVTLLSGSAQGKQATKYSLGSRHSVEPAWSLIRACEWDLEKLIRGLEQMDFSSNVRDNSLLQVHTDLTARKFFSKERTLLSPSRTGLLTPIGKAPAIWNAEYILRLVANAQFSDLRNEQQALPGQSDSDIKKDRGVLPVPSLQGLRLLLLDKPHQWIGQSHKGRLFLYRDRQPWLSLVPDFNTPAPRLKHKIKLPGQALHR
ncbi:MAG: hypothetical protein ACPGF7_06320 [Pontibacterium sp.]